MERKEIILEEIMKLLKEASMRHLEIALAFIRSLTRK